ncbi:MAG TPA: sialidase family protein [Candidatus Dormibacteraeota bacterium]|nr:sialidase family protein [Candidatus Dormibacteraeota bacterium]
MNRSLVVAIVGTALAGASAGLGTHSVSADTYPHLTANVDVTSANKAPGRDDAIPEVAVDPNDSHNIAVVEGDFRSGTCLLHVSTDGGATFTTAKLSPAPPQFEHCTPNAGAEAFPMVWGSDGALIVGMGMFNGTATVFGGPANYTVSRTTDYGNTWSYVVVKRNGPNATPEPTVAPPSAGLQPSENATSTGSSSTSSGAASTPSPVGVWQEHLASDGKGHIVAAWQGRNDVIPGVTATENRTYIAVSSDDGKSFGEAIDVEGMNDPTTFPNRRGPSVAFAPDGTLAVVFKEGAAPKGAPKGSLTPSLVAYTSSDLGKTFTRNVIQKNDDFTDYAEISASGAAMVVVWEDLSDVPAAQAQEVRDIFYSRSTDGGKTWSAKKRITDDDLTKDFANKYVPGIAVSPNGRLDVAWQDARNDDGHLLTDVYYTYSTDGGATWAPNLRVSDASSNRHYGQFANYSDVRGPVGVASDNYGAYIAWDDTRNATDANPAQDVYFAAVQQAALPVSSGYTTLRIVGAIVGGLLVTGLALVVAALIIRRRPGEPTSATA